MKMIVVSIKDRAADAFGRPACVAAEGVAIRQFQDEVNRASEDNQLYLHPDDFDMYMLGTFDDNTGKFELMEIPKVLALGKSVKISASA